MRASCRSRSTTRLASSALRRRLNTSPPACRCSPRPFPTDHARLKAIWTRIRGLVRPYEELGLGRLADTAEQFVAAAERAMVSDMSMKWRERADEFLKSCSWDSVWEGMNRLVTNVTSGNEKKT